MLPSVSSGMVGAETSVIAAPVMIQQDYAARPCWGCQTKARSWRLSGQTGGNRSGLTPGITVSWAMSFMVVVANLRHWRFVKRRRN